MTTGSGTPRDPDEPVGATLARMRRARRLTGSQLAALVGMSQPKISRIERGQGLPDPQDIGTLARALGADDELARALMNRAESAHDRMTDWRPTAAGLAVRQRNVGQWEAAAEVVRDFEPGVVPGLLQVSGYAGAILRAFQRLADQNADHSGESAVVAAVAGRIARQQILADPGRSFRFVITETVLRNRICPPAEMIAQIAHLRDVAAHRPWVRLAVIPETSIVGIPPLHGFTLLDDSLVIVDVYNTGLTSRGRNDVQRYRQVFDAFEQQATTDTAEIFDRYEARYIDLVRGVL